MPHDMVHAMTPVAQGGAVDVGHTTLLTDMEESTEGGDEAVLRLRLGEPSQEFLCPTTRDSIWSLTHFPGGAAAAGAGGADDYVFQVRVAKEGKQLAEQNHELRERLREARSSGPGRRAAAPLPPRCRAPLPPARPCAASKRAWFAAPARLVSQANAVTGRDGERNGRLVSDLRQKLTHAEHQAKNAVSQTSSVCVAAARRPPARAASSAPLDCHVTATWRRAGDRDAEAARPSA